MNQRPSDQQLLRDYCLTGSDAAFTELASRYAGLIYSSARRQLRDAHLAEDATQMVFLALARKARAVSRHKVPSAWLLQATRFACNNLKKRDQRQARRIQRVAAMHQPQIEQAHGQEPAEPDLWNAIAPHIDAAISQLREPERLALVLRFFDQKTHSQAALELGISEDSVRQRVSRAVAKLRQYLRARGIETTRDALTSAMAAHAVMPPPAGVLKAAAAAHAAGGLTAAKGTAVIMALTKSHLVAGLVVLAGVGTIAAVYTLRNPAPRELIIDTPHTPNTQQASPTSPTPASQSLSGTLLDPYGKPVSGARIQVGTPAVKAFVYKKPTRATYQTNERGQFSLNVPANAALVFTADAGCAIVTPPQFTGGNLTLQPWAQIHGKLTGGPKPMSDVTIHLWHFDRSDCFDSLDEQTARTDSQGNFHFHRVEPSTDISLSYPRSGGQYTAFLQAQPAETIDLTLGGPGRDVIGKAGPVLGSNPPIDWKPTPTRTSHGQLWYLEGPALTDAYKKRPMALFNIAPDGVFRLSDLPPGKYRAELRLITDPVGSRWTRPAMATADFTITNPANPTPIDLGTLPTQPAGG